MATEIDGFAVFSAMAANASLFEASRAEATKAARTAVTKQIKAKTLSLDHLRSIRTALGGDSFGLIVQGLKEAEIKSLATRLDKHHAEVKTMPAAERLRHLLALAHETEPVDKPARPAKGATAAKAVKSAKPPAPARTTERAPAAGKTSGKSAGKSAGSPERTLSSEAMAAKPPRRKSTSAH